MTEHGDQRAGASGSKPSSSGCAAGSVEQAAVVPPPVATPAVAEDEARPIPPRYWWLRRIALAAGLLMVGLVGLRLWWGWEADRRLAAKLAEYRARGEPVWREDFPWEPVPDERNRVPCYMNAAAALKMSIKIKNADGSTSDFGLYDTVTALRTPDNAALRQLVEANGPALKLLRAARSRPEVDWGPPAAAGGNWFLLRQFGLLARVSATVQHHAGDDLEALETLLDAAALASAMITACPELLASMCGQDVEEQVALALEAFGPEPGGAGGRTEEGRAEVRERVGPLLAQLLDEETPRRSLRKAMHWERMQILEWTTNTSTAGLPPQFGATGLFGPLWRLEGLRAAEHITATGRALTAGTWSEAQAQYPDELEFGLAGDLSVLRWILPTYRHSLGFAFEHLAFRRLTAVALALRLYELDHGRRPATLDALVPGYLPAVPADPFATDGRTIAYAPDRPSPVLYSVGRNGTDDGGSLERVASATGERRERDIVFFLNGDRPRRVPVRPAAQAGPPASQPASSATQAVDDQRDVEHGEPDQDE